MRRGQLQTLEPVIIVIMLVIILGVGLMFYVRISSSQTAQDTRDFQNQEDLKTMAAISNLPELSCPKGDTPPNCIDIKKASVFALLMGNAKTRTTYYPVLGASSITLQYLNLDKQDPNYRKWNILVVYNATEGTKPVQVVRTYFTMYEPVSKQLQFAEITIARER